MQKEIEKEGLTNVILKNPINREDLRKIYNSADYLFLHLNDYSAFRKVLPSKIFELATFKKPILAGVSGYSAQFINEQINNSFVFDPCDYKSLVNYLLNSEKTLSIDRTDFIKNFNRSMINEKMANSILNYIWKYI